MQITKFAHACFSVEKDGQSLVVDPGGWTDDFTCPASVVGIVVTHAHPDHFDADLLSDILKRNPAACIYGPEDVTTQLENLPTQTVSAGESVEVENFSLHFTGGSHAAIDSSMIVPANVGVIIDHSLYYPGDSFALPDEPIDTLAVPASAPWMKFSEAAAFIRDVQPRAVFPTHDAILSPEGKQLVDSMFGAVCKEIGAEYKRLDSQ